MELCQALSSTMNQSLISHIRASLPAHAHSYLVNNGGAFDTWLQSIPSLSGENDVTVTLHWLNGSTYELEWAGIIMVDQIEIEDMPSPSRVKLVANDGTAFLKTLRGDITETNSNSVDVLSGNVILDWLQEILTNTKSSVHWGNNDAFLRAWTDFRPDLWGNSTADGGQGTQGFDILSYAKLNGAYDNNTINVLNGSPEPYSDWTFLQSLCMLFNARLCLANGQWHFWPVNQHLMTADDYDWRYETRVYRKAGVLLPQSQQEYGEFYSRVTPQLGPAITAGRYVQMAGGSISHTIPLKNFRRTRPYRGYDYLNVAIRTGSSAAINVADNGLGLVDFHAPQSFFTGAKFNLQGNVQVKPIRSEWLWRPSQHSPAQAQVQSGCGGLQV